MANTCAFLQSTSPLDEVAPLLLLQRKPRKHPRIKNFSNLQARSGVATGKTETQTAHVPRLRGNKLPKQSDKLGWLQGPSEVARKREQARVAAKSTFPPSSPSLWPLALSSSSSGRAQPSSSKPRTGQIRLTPATRIKSRRHPHLHHLPTSLSPTSPP